jgi:hypothetical protein
MLLMRWLMMQISSVTSLKGLSDDLRLQLKITTYPDYHMPVNRAIVIDNERREIDAKKRRF